jgi:predicted site-specific integrase-resolvase
MAAEPWLTAKELARRERVSVPTIRRWVRRGIVEKERYGAARLRYRLRSPEAYRLAEAYRTGKIRRNDFGEVLIDD